MDADEEKDPVADEPTVPEEDEEEDTETIEEEEPPEGMTF